MKTRTAAHTFLVGVLLLAGYAAMNTVTREPRTTNTMPKPKHLAPNADGRVYAVVQLCWRPAEERGTVHYVIGPIDRVDGVFNLDCREPFQRKGLVSNGDRVAISWAMGPDTTLRGVKYRITINNRTAMEGEDPRTTKLYGCIVGVPPC